MDLLDQILSSDTKPTSIGIYEKDGMTYCEGIRIDNMVTDQTLFIDEKTWAELNATHPRQRIVYALAKAIEYYDVKLPFVENTEKEVVDDFLRLLQLPVDEMIGLDECVGRVKSSKYQIGNKFIKNEKIGRISSNYFQQDNRLRCSYYNSQFIPSPYTSWTTQKYREVVLKALWSLNYDKIDTSALRSVLSLRGYVAPQFPPAAAKFFYDKFKAKKVLDFSAGWGDRLCGFFASNAQEYVGLDPNPLLHPNYQKQIEFYNKHIYSNKKSTLIQTPAEDFNYSKYEGYFDMIFTSPPYFDRERYNDDESQSWVRYRSLDEWLNGFLFKTLEGCWRSLAAGGYLIVNIADVRVRTRKGHHFLSLCEPMNDKIGLFPKSMYLGCINLQLAQRPGKKVGVPVEPVWIWKKDADGDLS